MGSCQVKHFELPLTRFDLPPNRPAPPSSPSPIFREHTTKPRAPTIRYCFYPPPSPIGPLDLVSIPVFLSPLHDAVSIRSATVMIERRLQLNEPNGQSSLSHSPTRPISQPHSPLHSFSPAPSYQDISSLYSTTSIISGLSSSATITPDNTYPSSASVASETQPLLHLPHSSPISQTPSKTISTPIVEAESTGQFVRDNQGVWSKTLTLQWPAAKSHSRWAIGETIQSDLVSVKFFIRIKVRCPSLTSLTFTAYRLAQIAVSSPYGTDSIELREQELLIVSTSESERQLALSKYNELINNHTPGQLARSKSRSPRRPRRDPELPDRSLPSSSQKGSGKYKSERNITGSVADDNDTSRPGGSKVAPRRPHTSAGPRDKLFARRPNGAYGQERDLSGSSTHVSASKDMNRPGTSQSQGEVKRRSGVVSRGYSFFSSSPRIGTAASAGTSSSASASGSLTASTSRSTTSSLSSSHGKEGDCMREWEDELAKIEIRSRKSSDMLGFGKRIWSIGTRKEV